MEDFNIEEFAKMFDAALASDNPAVKKSLRNFLMVMAIVDSENTREPGPMQTLLKRLDTLESQMRSLSYPGGFSGGGSYYNNPTWIATSSGGTIPYTGGYSSGTVTSSVSSSSASTLTEKDIVDLLSDLKSETYWTDDELSSLEQAYKDSNAT